MKKSKKYPLKKSSHRGRPRKWTQEKIAEEIKALERWMSNPKNFFLTGFLVERNLHWEHTNRFCKMSEKFREAYIKATLIQEQRIVENSLLKKFDGNFAKFVLQNRGTWKEKSEISGDSQNPLAIMLEKIAKRPAGPLEEV